MAISKSKSMCYRSIVLTKQPMTAAEAARALDLGILRAGSGSGRAKKSLVFFLAARARPDPVAGP